MTESHLLHAILVKDDQGRNASPGRLAPPALVVTHAVVELKRVDLEQVEVDQQRRLASCFARPAGTELGLHAIEASAPEPVIVPLAEDRPGMRFSLVVPELAVHVPDPVKPAGALFSGSLIDVEPGRDRGMDVQVTRVGTVSGDGFLPTAWPPAARWRWASPRTIEFWCRDYTRHSVAFPTSRERCRPRENGRNWDSNRRSSRAARSGVPAAWRSRPGPSSPHRPPCRQRLASALGSALS